MASNDVSAAHAQSGGGVCKTRRRKEMQDSLRDVRPNRPKRGVKRNARNEPWQSN
jgi:hypothetical protein